MGLGSTAKRLQTMVDLAETLLARVKDIKERVEGTQETVDDTNARVAAIESELAEQRTILERLADDQGVDVSDVAEAAAVTDSDSDGADDNA